MENNQNLLTEDNWSPIKNLCGKFQLKKKTKSILNEDESIDDFVSSIKGGSDENKETSKGLEVSSSYRTKEENENVQKTTLVSMHVPPNGLSSPIALETNITHINPELPTVLANSQTEHKQVVFQKPKTGVDLVFEDYKMMKDNIYYVIMAVFNCLFPIAFTYYLMNNFDFIKKQADTSSPMGYFVLGNIFLMGVFVSFIIHLLVNFLRKPKKTN